MTQEENQLLLTDLCARLQYGVKFKIGDYSDYNLIGIVISDEHPIKIEVIEKAVPYKIEVSLDIIKPYLRPMSSMTEHDRKEYYYLCEICAGYYSKYSQIKVFDWLNKNMFDYRIDDEGKTMIEKGLALEAPDGMYEF